MKSIVVGWAPGELLPDSRGKSKVPENYRSAILGRAYQMGSARKETATTALEVIDNWALVPGTEIEVYGVWGDLCVSILVAHCLDRGLKVYVPKGCTANYPRIKGSLNSFVKDSANSLGICYETWPWREYRIFEPVL
ncbi:MAG: hypothetical protein JW727_05545 [Candidatus Aenigmarchaeota archaeon]|nr:hypothetical protein [Candidatus Aenigmarchaeota archaeon]